MADRVISYNAFPAFSTGRVRASRIGLNITPDPSEEGPMERHRVWQGSLTRLALGLFLIATVFPALAGQEPEPSEADRDDRLAPFVPTPETIVDAMLQLAKVNKNDTVYDLGSGDGRIVIMA